MSRFGWAYVNDVITGSGGTPGGSDKAIQFASGSSFSGSTNFTFDYTTNTVKLTGTLYADNLIVSSSQILKSGSTIFGDSAGDTHQITGSVYLNNPLYSVAILSSSDNLYIGGSTTVKALDAYGVINAYSTLSGTTAQFTTLTGSQIKVGGSTLTTTGSLTVHGSTKLGSYGTDTHQFTGSVYLDNSLNVNAATNITGNLRVVGQISASNSITSNSDISAVGNITSLSGSISASSGISSGGSITSATNITAKNVISGSSLQISNGGSFGSSVTVTGSVSASANLQTAGDVTAGMNLTVNNFANIKNGLIVTGSSAISGSLNVIGTMSSSFINGNGTGITDINGINVNGVGDDWTIQFKDGNTGTLTGSSNLTFSGSTLTLTGIVSASAASFNILTASNSLVTNITTVGNYVQLLPVNVVIPTNQTASYIYTSGSTNDIYFTQYSASLTNTTRLRWLEGSLGSGLQYGGLLTTVNGTTAFNVSAGSGLIVTQNASTSSDPYPTIKQISWSNVVSQSLLYSGSAQISYISIDSTGQVAQSITPPTLAQFKDRIVLGRILHQSASVTNGTINSPAMSYAQTANIFDFIRSFGPLKISGHILAASGSTLGITKTAGASYSEGRNYSSDPENPNIILASADPEITVTKIFREYVSGSTPIINTNGNVGYTVIDPAQYNNNGTLAAVGNSEWTNQRVYWFPKSVNQAFFVYYGTQKFGTLVEAVSGLLTENFTEGENTANAAIYVGSITLKGNESNLSDTTNVRISQGGLFRAAGGGGGGGGGSTPPGGLTTEVQFNDGGAFAGDTDFTFSKTTNTLSVPNIIASSYVGNGSGLTDISIPKYAIFYANGVTTGSNYELLTVNSNKYLQLQRRKTFPTARAIGLTNSEYGWTWLNRSSLSSVSSSTENVSSSNAANLIHSSLSNTTWFGGTATAPVRYKEYNLQVGQSLQIITKTSAYAVSNYDQTQTVVWLSGSVDKYVRFGVGYDNGLNATAQSNVGSTTNHSLTSGEIGAGIWWTAYVTPTQFSLYYNLSTGSTPPTTGWLFSQGNNFVNAAATSVGNKINVGQMIMTGKSDAAITSTGSFHYYDVQLKPDEEAGYFVPNSYYRWGSAQYDTSGTEQLIGEFDLGSTSATVDQTKLRLALADLVNNISGDSATVTWSAVQSSSAGASSSTFYDASSVVISGTGRYFRLWVKITSTSDNGGSIGPFPITIPVS